MTRLPHLSLLLPNPTQNENQILSSHPFTFALIFSNDKTKTRNQSNSKMGKTSKRNRNKGKTDTSQNVAKTRPLNPNRKRKAQDGKCFEKVDPQINLQNITQICIFKRHGYFYLLLLERAS